jgi:hypothetical protein
LNPEIGDAANPEIEDLKIWRSGDLPIGDLVIWRFNCEI